MAKARQKCCELELGNEHGAPSVANPYNPSSLTAKVLKVQKKKKKKKKYLRLPFFPNSQFLDVGMANKQCYTRRSIVLGTRFMKIGNLVANWE